jgi:hypothetical protein
VASALLDAAVAYAAEHGARIVEGYPADTGGARMTAASAYLGTVPMFERAGFRVTAPTTSKAARGLSRVVVRRET